MNGFSCIPIWTTRTSLLNITPSSFREGCCSRFLSVAMILNDWSFKRSKKGAISILFLCIELVFSLFLFLKACWMISLPKLLSKFLFRSLAVSFSFNHLQSPSITNRALVSKFQRNCSSLSYQLKLNILTKGFWPNLPEGVNEDLKQTNSICCPKEMEGVVNVRSLANNYQ